MKLLQMGKLRQTLPRSASTPQYQLAAGDYLTCSGNASADMLAKNSTYA